MSARRGTLRLRAWALLVALVTSLSAAGVAYASFAAQATTGGQTLRSRSLGAPGSLSASASGHDLLLAWSAGTNGSGYIVQSAANGLSSDCSAASFSGGSSTATTSYTDSGRYTPQGSWVCYRVETAYRSWTSISSNPVAAAQVGFVVDSVSDVNGGLAGQLDSGDRVTVSFDQSVSSTSGPSGTDTVCITSGASAMLVLASTKTSGNCAASESTQLGTIANLSATSSARWRATYSWAAADTLAITIGTRITGSSNPTVASTGAAYFDPTNTTSALLSSSGGYHVCDTNTTGSDCLPAISGSL